jgi:hypothetical protein
VLTQIYQSLRISVLPAEYDHLPSRDVQRMVNDSYRRRYKRIMVGRAYEEEKAKGLKRVDFLMDANRFMGLTATQHGPAVWELNVS